jgi:glycosyltransferase involved in cell wall biosynthesis
LKVVFYSYPSYLDCTFPLVQELSKRTELHLIVEVSPEMRQTTIMDLTSSQMNEGLLPAEPVFKDVFISGVSKYWQNCADIKLVVHRSKKSVSPSSWRVSHQAAAYVRALKPDIIHCNDLSLRTAWAIRKLKKIPIVMSIHDPEPHSGEKNWRIDLARKITFNTVDGFILHSEFSKQRFHNRYGIPERRLFCIKLGSYNIYREWADNSIATDHRCVLFFGRLSPYKGIDVLYKATNLVAEKVPNVRFVIAGQPIAGYQPPAPPSLVHNGRIDVIRQYISNMDLTRLFQKAAVVVCPYRDATQSGVVLTAYAFNKPVIATNVGGLPEYVIEGQTGFLIAGDKPQEIARALIKILTGSHSNKKLESGIRKAKQDQFSWSEISHKTLQTYRQVCGTPGSGVN